mgnify:CR=1 FL=1
MKTYLLCVTLCAGICLALAGNTAAQSVNSDFWAATDALGRKVREYGETGERKKDKFVAMFYWTWHIYDMPPGSQVNNTTEILREHPEAIRSFDDPAWNNPGRYYWEQPLFGYYKTTDPWVLRKHAEMLADAGIDVVFFDCTNLTLTWKESYDVLMEVWSEALKDGVKAPKIAFMLPFGSPEYGGPQLHMLYEDIYKPGRHRELWFVWKGKPCIMARPEDLGDTPEDREIADLVRKEKQNGLVAVTDGEFRRSFWHLDFIAALSGIKHIKAEAWSVHFEGKQPKAETVVIDGRIGFPENHPFLDAFDRLKKIAGTTPVKYTIPSPSMLHLICCVRATDYQPIDIYRDNEERLFDDIAQAMVRGYQGKDMSRNDEIMACVKHFALYGAGEAGRDYNTVDMSHQRMFNEYMLPYQAAVDAGVGSAMASFNEVDGIPATGNKWLMTDILRKQWGFDGFVVTDYTGIAEMTDHGMGDTQTVAALALNAGVDMDMVSDAFVGTLKKSLTEGKVTEEAINAACRRILEAKYKLGLFDNPYKYCDVKRAKKQIFTKEHRAVARKIASESLVLLKNEGNVLPLAKKGTIAVVGPLADSRSNMPGTWSVAAVLKNATSLAEGLKAVAGDKAEILTAKGCNLMSDAEYEKRATMFGRSLHRDNRSDKELLDEALAVAAKSDVIVAALGESSEMSGESSCRTNLEMTDTQRMLLQELLKTGKPVVLVLFTGRPLVLNWEQANVPAILNVWFAGSEAGFAIGDVLFGDVNPSGKLTTTFPKSVGQIPLFYNHKNTGRPLADGAWFQKFRSNYIDIDNEPLYPFGFGLSYTTFSYSDVSLDKTSMTDKGELTATVTVTNTGKRDGAEVVQLYIRDLVGSVTRPVKELKGFEKIFLKAGESKKVSFKITPELLKFYNYNLDFVCESGDFEVMIGRNSQDVKKAAFKLL